MVEVLAPNLGQSGMDVTIEQWFKKEGESVEKGEMLFEISNEKLNQEIEAPATGTLTKILKNEGETAAPEEVIAIIE